MRSPYSRWVVGLAAGFALAALFGAPALAESSRSQMQIAPPLNQELTILPQVGKGLGLGDQIQVLVVLQEPGAAEVFSQAKAAGKAAPEAFAAAQSQFFALEAAQQTVAAALAAKPIGATEIFRVKRALNAISVYTTRGQLAAIRALPGVKAVHIVEPEYPTNWASVPFIGAPQVWTDTLGLGKNLTGAGVKIGIIDTGIDYLHANFGGNGLSATYTAAAAATTNFTTLGGGFPSAKVVGGWDFAGDLYTGSNAPTPDPNPMDCGGHGSHVAGTAAGYGVTTGNATFAGPYNTSVPFGSLKIGPGVAPLASLYSLRVFGCGGSTGLTVDAIDWAMDPNNDGDMSDHLDVINMSLGSPFGHPADTSAMASEEAAAIGVVVVASAGNAGDTFFIAGSPANSARTISTAAVGDPNPNYPFVLLVVNTPGGIAGNYAATGSAFVNADSTVPPPVNNQTAAVLYPGTNQNGCAAYGAGTFTNSFALINRGTCNFSVKIQNAEAAGAIGVIIDNNAANAPLVNMGGAVAGTDITIPSIFISLETGATLKANLSGLNVTFAARNAADTLASFSSRGPRPDAPIFLKPDVAAPGLNITSTLTGWTCDGVTIKGCIFPTNVSGDRIFPNSQAAVLSGTSMASPHMAGTMALLKQLHPDWSVEELKALAMNTALHNVSTFPSGGPPRDGPDLIGTGREDVPLAAQNKVVAFNGDDAGAVSVSFGAEVIGAFNATKTVKVANKGTTDQTFTLGLEMVVANPGVSFSVPPSVTVPAGETVSFNVTMAGTANLLTHPLVDLTVAPFQSNFAFSGSTARQWLTEHAGYITFSQASVLKMRVPVFSAPVPASTMSGGVINTGGNPSGLTTIALSGGDVCTGTYAPPNCTGSFPTTEVSLVSPFELQAAHPVASVSDGIPPYQNLQYAGVAYDPVFKIMMFGLSTWGDWSTPSDVTFTIWIDCGIADANGNCTGAPDGTYDRVIFDSNFGTVSQALFATSGAGPTDTFFSFNFNFKKPTTLGATYPLNIFTGDQLDTRVFSNNVRFIPTSPQAMGFASGTPGAFKYKIETCPGYAPGCGVFFGGYVDAVGESTPLFWNPAAQGLDFGTTEDWLSNDINGATLPLTFNTANLATNGSLGALLLHHHNKAGTRAQVVLLSPDGSAQGADVGITASTAPPNPPVGSNVVITLTVTNHGPAAATGVVVAAVTPLSPPVSYVSDDGGGALSTSTGLWTIPGTLALNASATLHITLKVLGSGPMSIPFMISSSTPLDPNPANNTADAIINAALTADLSVTKTADPTAPMQGQTVTFTITVSNAGPDTAFNVVVNDLLNSGFTYQNSSASAGVYNHATGVWTIASMATGTSETLSITATVAKSGNLSNSVNVTSDAFDPVAANNQFTLAVNTTPPIPLLSGWGLLLITAVLALCGLLVLRRLA
jgi:uncharacterized repeat protein (TIGR01451 family)